ncbi:MAG: asparaginase, partial [Paracoccaceae bacterium]|nr:asparaginase [Paracoccaceae bacterium]
MAKPVDLVEVWRGDLLECVHQGHAVVCDDTGQIIHAWGDPTALIYPRSSCKMIQALPLLESGAGAHLVGEQLALCCASHKGAAIHTDRIGAWLKDLGLSDDDFRCGPEMPRDQDARYNVIRAFQEPCQIHNNCSGKHAGFLTLTKHLKAGPDYELIDHPVQQAWAELDVPQCGYCQPGMIMTAAALLSKNPDPSDAEIDATMTNICRCGTFNRVRRGIHL